MRLAAAIRGFRRDDLEQLVALDHSCFDPGIAYSRSELAFYVRRPGATTKIAEMEDRIVGFAVGKCDARGIAHVITLDIIAGARRQGIGTLLLRALHDEFVKRHARLSILEVSVENVGAIRFYEGMGYQRGELLPGYYDGRTDAHRMFHLFPRAVPG
jgi:[ribosomal protein S18]-alanine N-acetyltransferase